MGQRDQSESEILVAQAAETRGLVESLGEADFSRASPGCPGWQVQNLVAHLATGAQLFQMTLDGTGGGARWMEDRARISSQLAALSPRDLKSAYFSHDTSFIARVRSLTESDLRETRVHPAYGMIPVAQFVRMRTTELTVHAWDIRSAKDADARATGPGVRSALMTLLPTVPAWFRSDRLASRSQSYRLLVPETSIDRKLQLAEGKAEWVDGGTQADATLSLGEGDLLLLLSGRLTSRALIERGRAQAEGNRGALEELSSLFQAYGGR